MSGYKIYYKLYGKWKYSSIFLKDDILEESKDSYFSLTYIPLGMKYSIYYGDNNDICLNKVKRMTISGLEQRFELQKYNLKEHNKNILK